jgi:hypothetical protein
VCLTVISPQSTVEDGKESLALAFELLAMDEVAMVSDKKCPIVETCVNPYIVVKFPTMGAELAMYYINLYLVLSSLLIPLYIQYHCRYLNPNGQGGRS